jgi:hypothetical protein
MLLILLILWLPMLKTILDLGDQVTVIDSLGSTQDSTVTEIISDYSFSIKGQGNIAEAKYTVERKILRAQCKIFFN